MVSSYFASSRRAQSSMLSSPNGQAKCLASSQTCRPHSFASSTISLAPFSLCAQLLKLFDLCRA